jgi:hypothetical protein
VSCSTLLKKPSFCRFVVAKKFAVEHNLNRDGNYEFLVKWKDYDISDNSWVHENDFNEKTIIKVYFDQKKIKY